MDAYQLIGSATAKLQMASEDTTVRTQFCYGVLDRIVTEMVGGLEKVDPKRNMTSALILGLESYCNHYDPYPRAPVSPIIANAFMARIAPAEQKVKYYDNLLDIVGQIMDGLSDEGIPMNVAYATIEYLSREAGSDIAEKIARTLERRACATKKSRFATRIIFNLRHANRELYDVIVDVMGQEKVESLIEGMQPDLERNTEKAKASLVFF